MPFPRRARLALTALLLGAVLTGCARVGDDTSPASPVTSGADRRHAEGERAAPTTPAPSAPAPPEPAPTTSAAAAPAAVVDLGPAPRYVALGDSFSAGGGLGPYEDRACGRSARAYPHLLQLVAGGAPEVHACEAARVASVAAQAAAAGLDARVGLVTVTVGGNDVGFVDFFGACALRPACFEGPYAGAATLRAWSEARLAALGPALHDLLVDLRAQVPNGRVALLGYPQLLPATIGAGPGCGLLSAAIDESELAGLRAATIALNAVLADTAAVAGVTFVPVAERFAGHEACAGDEPWLLLGGVVDMLGAPEGLLHPNDTGQAAYAAALAEALRS